MQRLMPLLLSCSIAMSLLALMYMALTPLLAKRYSVTSRYYAWLIIVIGLIIPFRPQLDKALVKINLPQQAFVPLRPPSGAGASAALYAPAPDALSPAALSLSWWQLTATLWLAGMLLFLAYQAFKHHRFLKLTVRWSQTVADQQTLALLQNLKTQMGISQNIALQRCDSIGSPLLIGFLHPRILLPRKDFTPAELCFILKHELVHYKRGDLYYKALVLTATAIHWFNPLVRLMARAIDLQCELSCDAEVVRSASADTRLLYSQTILGVVSYQSKLKTALSTHFYGGKTGMKNRIFSIMDRRKKKTGAVILCSALLLTLGTGFALAANVQTPQPEVPQDNPLMVTPWIAIDGFVPSPDIYAPYAAFGITLSADGQSLLYKGQPVRQFVDEKADGWAFYLDEAGTGNWSAVRNAAGEITGIDSMSAQDAQACYERFFADELSGSLPTDYAVEMVEENVQIGPNKYEQYQPFGITYSPTDEAVYFDGQRVKFLLDQPIGEGPDTLWTDAQGSVNLVVLRDASGQITRLQRLSDEEAQAYPDASADYGKLL